jgi:hypothetical protein
MNGANNGIPQRTLTLPTQPDNYRSEHRGQFVESDVYNICNRIQEVDRSLYVYDFGRDAKPRYSVCEMCKDGVERLVYRPHELDGRVVEHVQYLLHVPFDTRFAQAEALEAKRAEEQKQYELDKLTNDVGLPMLKQLEHDGFIETRGRSYAKRGVHAR